MYIILNIGLYINILIYENDGKYGEQGIVGDQLTVERFVNGHASIANGFTQKEQCTGLHAEVADWHSGNRFLQV